MLPALILTVAIRAELWRPLKNKQKQNGSNISISVLSCLHLNWTGR